MEKVQFQLESTLPEIKDLEEKGIFNKAELKQITSRRTRYETSLIKRVANKADFLEYAEYEIGLEKLRKLRWKRMKLDSTGPQRSISCYSIPRRVVYILRRATQKFSYDVSVWLAYVEYARSERMTKVVQEGLTSALQLHPLSPLLYLLLSYHYLHPNAAPPHASSSSSHNKPAPSTAFALEGVSSARTTLLIGLRLLPADQDLWREYIKLEMGWVEALRRRWKVLGIMGGKDIPVGGGEEKMQADITNGLQKTPLDLEGADEVDLDDAGTNAFGTSGEPARKAIIRGDLITTVLKSSLSNPTLSTSHTYHLSLLKLLRDHPSPLRQPLLAVVYAHMRSLRDVDARLSVIVAPLYDRVFREGEEARWRTVEERGYELEEGEDEVVVEGEALVRVLGEVVGALKGTQKGLEGLEREWREKVGLWLLKWASRVQEEELKTFLLASLSSLTKSTANPTPLLLSSHAEYLSLLPPTSPSLPSYTKLLALLSSYVSIHPTSPALWTTRLALETRYSTNPASLGRIWIEGMSAVGASPGGTGIWVGGMEWFDKYAGEAEGSGGMKPHWVQTLAAAKKLRSDSKFSRVKSEGLYSTLLAAWARAQLVSQDVGDEASLLRSAKTVLGQVTSATTDAPYSFYPVFFPLLTSLPLPPTYLASAANKLKLLWVAKSTTDDERVSAVLAWCAWAVGAGQAKDAWTAVQDAGREIGGRARGKGVDEREDERLRGEGRRRLEEGWKVILEGLEGQGEDGGEEMEVDEDDE